MIASNIRAQARESLNGKWGKAALMALAFGFIFFIISFLLNFIPVLGTIALLIIELPLAYGFIVSLIKLKRDEEINYTDFLSIGFSSIGKVWGVIGNIILKMIIPVCLLIFSILIMAFGFTGSIIGVASFSSSIANGFTTFGIIGLICYIASLIYVIVKGYLYSLSYYILYDNPNMTGKEVIEESERLMRGNRWGFFWLNFTFIGWAILAAFTFGIALIWLSPYVMISCVCFYETLKNSPVKDLAENSTEK